MYDEITATRDFDLPPSIVWDAFVEPVLVEGWLAAAEIDPHPGGTVRLRWLDGHHGEVFEGVVAAFEPGSRMVLRADREQFEVRLDALAAGTRGAATRVGLVVAGEGIPRHAAGRRREWAHWCAHLEALEDLLRGHPVIWERWEVDYGALARAFAAGPAQHRMR